MHGRKYILKVGDIVSCAAGGPRMRVAALYSADHYHANKVECEWIDHIDEAPKKYMKVFPRRDINVVEPR